MGVLLSSVKWQVKLAYLDDIVIIFNSSDEYIDDVWQVLTLLNEAG